MRILRSLAAFAAIAALVFWGLTLPLLGRPSSLPIVVGVGVATLLTLSAQSPKLQGSSLVLWVSGGIWAGAAYVNTEVIGLGYVFVAILTLGSAAVRERERGKFSLSGPAAFIAAMVLMLAVSNVLSG